ncbi:nucleosome assembly protein [Morchella snyderi]|nr:nucleosome assembly protein [Morchella snyderi]
MSEPIRNKKLDTLAGAPTPQNTPSVNAPINSHAVEPKVSTIKEEQFDRATAASIFASDPRLVSMIQGKLGSLVGRSSGYIESLPPAVRRRIAGLKGVQKEHSKIEADFQEEVLQLEKKYFAKFTPLYQKRAKIVNGTLEPSEDEVKAGKADDEEEDDDEEKEDVKTEDKKDAEDLKGVPEFWLSAMKNHLSLAETITDRDEAALKHLTDIRMTYLDRPGFKLIFEFAENDFFTNKEITKTYYYQEESGYGGDFIYDHAEGDKINWKEGKDLTVRVESKKQRNKNTKQTRVVKRTVPTESFFNFFSPPEATGGDEEDDEASTELEERLELDYHLGEDIKEKLIPRAVDWYTGEALQFEELEDDMDNEEFDDDEDDDDELSEDKDDDDEESEDEDDGTKPKQEAADCKQS